MLPPPESGGFDRQLTQCSVSTFSTPQPLLIRPLPTGLWHFHRHVDDPSVSVNRLSRSVNKAITLDKTTLVNIRVEHCIAASLDDDPKLTNAFDA